MDTIVIKPKNKSELHLLRTLLKQMDIKSKIIKEESEHSHLKQMMLDHSKKFFINKMD